VQHVSGAERQRASKNPRGLHVEDQRTRRTDVTDDERQKTEALISRLEIAVGEIYPRDGSNAGLIASMIQALNGLRSMLGLVRPH
jgi:hypothetical protein